MTWDTWRCAWREIRRRKARAIATMCGYALAVAVIVAVTIASRGSRSAADDVLTSTGTHFIAFVPASLPVCPQCVVRRPESGDEGFVAAGVSSALFATDLVERIKRLPTVSDASPFLLYRFKGADDGHGFTVGGFDLGNTLAVRTTCCAAKDLVEGRFLTAEDRGKVMLEEAYAQLRNLRAEDRVRIGEGTFEVVGIVNPGIRPAKADVYMPLGEARQAINARMGSEPVQERANIALVEVAGAKVQDEAIRSVRSLLPGLVVSSYACYRPAARVMGINERGGRLLMLIISAGALLLAAKTEWTWVIERRREIGILKAIGWTDGNVVGQILAESVLQALGGAVVGVGVAVVWLWALGGLHGAGSLAGPLGAGLSLAAAGGLVAGIVPALAAARQRPSQALRAL